MDVIHKNIEKNNPNKMDDFCKNFEKKPKNNPHKKRIIFIVFDDMIPDMRSNKNLNLIVTE